jgi:hypothetical protein
VKTVDEVALGQVFFEYLDFPSQFVFYRLFHSHNEVSSGAGSIGQTVAAVPSGLSLTPMTKKKTTEKRVKPQILYLRFKN